ncbi:hypothetical protein AQUCO_01000517v1 [Aquilegia coerulea]|uniref:CBF1-interacting co-repressor CIR N-terminal domain-containing protein n=1 Tax=Aquilegia coerulea TaxID=218851 RepID=A0A2G5EAG5_AQUCA|nr:hypothetical protein AQUCO_01000517v1 [Aquilegia coerulea]
MALKFLNKKGWHTGSLRNIENVWKAEQKHDAEQRKLDELRKQIQEEREKSEFRQLQEQAGLVPRQERLDFLYDSGLACGKSSEGFKTLESLPKSETDLAAAAIAATSTAKEKSSAPGALFEEKPQSANDAWRKLHSDPLLLIRQREQEALARIKNNPVQMANIRKSVEEKKKHKEKSGKKKEHKKRSHKSSKHEKHASLEGQSSEDDDSSEEEERRKRRVQYYDRKRVEQYSSHGRSDSETEEKSKKVYDKYSSKSHRSEDGDNSEGEERKRRSQHYDRKKVEQYSSHGRLDSETEEKRKRGYDKYSLKSRHSDDDNASDGEERYKRRHHHDRKQYSSHGRSDAETEEKRKRGYEKYSSSKVERSEKDAPSEREERNKRTSHYDDRKPEPYSSRARLDLDSEEMRGRSNVKSNHERHSTQIMEAPRENSERSQQRQRRPATKLSEEEKAARLREMQLDAEMHEEQRWKRLKNASENDAREASLASSMGGRNFLDAAQSSVYGAEKGGSSTIEESVRRRKYYSQGQSESNNEGNAFRR